MSSIPFGDVRTFYSVAMVTPLVICIGNTARGDDGVAHSVARRLGPHVIDDRARVITAMDLDISMAEQIADAGLVVVVDAERRDSPAVRTTQVASGGPAPPSGHGIDASSLLALAEALYGGRPAMWLVSLAAPQMGHSEHLSAVAKHASVEAVPTVLRLLGCAELEG